MSTKVYSCEAGEDPKPVAAVEGITPQPIDVDKDETLYGVDDALRIMRTHMKNKIDNACDKALRDWKDPNWRSFVGITEQNEKMLLPGWYADLINRLGFEAF